MQRQSCTVINKVIPSSTCLFSMALSSSSLPDADACVRFISWYRCLSLKYVLNGLALLEFGRKSSNENLLPSLYTTKDSLASWWVWKWKINMVRLRNLYEYVRAKNVGITVIIIPLGKTSTDVERSPYFGPIWKFYGRPHSTWKLCIFSKKNLLKG